MSSLAGRISPIVGATLLALCTISPVLAQTGTGAAKKDAASEQVIITNKPAEMMRLRERIKLSKP